MFNREIEKIFVWIVKIGLWIIPFLPLYVSSSMLFPFITGKNFTFRIIVEVILIFWIWLVVFKEEYRPKLTPLIKAATVFISVLFLADLFGMNPYRSFFSNYERMEGFMMTFHLYLYFLMLASVFRKRDWIIFFHSTLAASLIVSYIGLLQKLGYRVSLQGGFRVDSTIGNPTYLASYLLFHIWLLALLTYKFWKKWWLAVLYAAFLLFELAILYFTATRGAVLALILTFIPFGAAVLWFWPKVFARPVRSLAPPTSVGGVRKDLGEATSNGVNRGRIVVAAVFLVLLLVPIAFWQLRSMDFIKQNPVLSRLTSYSFEERTIQSRLMIWGMSYKASLERPLLGWGQENYYLVFQKYFDPGLFANEPWFDRSHNVIFDWLIHAGFLGLLSYLSMFGAAVWMIIRAMRKNLFPYWEGFVIMGVFSTYFLQNLFVFDNLNTYLLLFAFLGYTQFLGEGAFVSSPLAVGTPQSKKSYDKSYDFKNAPLAYAVSGSLLVLVLVGGYFLHIAPIVQSKALIRALQTHQMQPTADQLIDAFKKALSYNSFGTTEVREQLSNLARSVVDNTSFSPEDKKKFINFTVEELRKESAHDSKDVKHLLFIGAILSRASQVDPSYILEAERTLQEAIKLSPTKQIIYFELAQLYLYRGEVDKSIEVLRRAWELDKNYHEAGVNVLIVALLNNKTDIAEEVKPQIPIEKLEEQSASRLGQVLQRVGDFETALKIYEGLARGVPRNAQYHASYAALLGYFGRKEEAKREVEEAVRLDPNMSEQAKEFIRLLEQSGTGVQAPEVSSPQIETK